MASEEITNKLDDLKVEESPKVSDNSSTVLKSTQDFNTIHPFSSSWTLWYVKPKNPQVKEDWKDLLTEVVSFSSVEEFWGAYNNLPKVSELPFSSDYALFKTNIRPEWEDKQNSEGGKIVFSTKDSGPSPSAIAAAAAGAGGAAANTPLTRIDEIWLNILLGLVGGTLDVTNDPTVPASEQKINGVFVNVRRAAVRFNIWTKDLDVENIRPIASRFKDLIKIDQKEELEFAPLDSSKSKSRNNKKNL